VGYSAMSYAGKKKKKKKKKKKNKKKKKKSPEPSHVTSNPFSLPADITNDPLARSYPRATGLIHRHTRKVKGISKNELHPLRVAESKSLRRSPPKGI